MASVKKEIPAWTIDGANKVFVLSNVPSQIDDVFMDGAIYVTFSIVWSVLTLADAPTSSLFVDYDTKSTSDPVASPVTFGDMKQEVWDLLAQTANSTTFSTKKVWNKLNQQLREIWRWRVKSLLDKNVVYRAGKLWFSEAKASLRIKEGSALDADFEVWDSVISCATANLLPYGYVRIGGEVFSYSGKTATQLIGVTGWIIKHLQTEKVAQLYSMPVGFERPTKAELVLKDAYARTSEIPYDPTDSKIKSYSVITYGSVHLLKFVGIQAESVVTVTYSAVFNDMVNDGDICPLPGDYGITAVATLTAGEMAYVRGLPNGERILNLAYSSLQNMYQFFTNDVNVIVQSIKPVVNRPFNRHG